MNLAVVFRPEARAELRDAREWYDGKIQGLGDRFARTVASAIHTIRRHPEAFPRVHSDMRQCVLGRFPYSIFFRITDQHIVILAVHDERKNPERWRDRIR